MPPGDSGAHGQHGEGADPAEAPARGFAHACRLRNVCGVWLKGSREAWPSLRGSLTSTCSCGAEVRPPPPGAGLGPGTCASFPLGEIGRQQVSAQRAVWRTEWAKTWQVVRMSPGAVTGDGGHGD